MDGALFSLLFFFFVQISAGAAPMKWPHYKWIADVIFWISMAGAAVCLLWYGVSQDWLSTAVNMVGQKATGLMVVLAGMALAIFGLSLIAAPPKAAKFEPPRKDQGMPSPSNPPLRLSGGGIIVDDSSEVVVRDNDTDNIGVFRSRAVIVDSNRTGDAAVKK